MRKFYVEYWNDFANTYNLFYTENKEQEKQAEEIGMERITRKEAERLCAIENYRRNNDPAFSGYAHNVIIPFSYDGDWRNDRTMRKNGYIIDRRK